MRPIKFEICIRRKDGSDLYFEHLTLNDLLNRNGCIYNPNTQEIVYQRMFTGLNDKNGKEIYEGDIIKTTGYTGFVEYESQAAQYWIKWVKNGNRYMSFNATYGDETGMTCDYLEIIGNIYENPELLNNKTT